ncbi:toll/interleukin-1 receptor domain-containing protein [Horticoccus luteus]|uniref:Toll/interleukin-1 receptor domain-containing protein n=1 Tax=Horticoccus luteus TaxID=2862869 RepID=A0A8F9TU02_9BACT|nr:toll/interleukin-1 receptor domain-containing protein [Horticoccus luteus]QYM78268.1 toll/interleukin-1 receptor domain-containing protein [Horticoccus luteus]
MDSSFSIFISYASADRAQARLLGHTMADAGLDVWFDEEELAGGEAWDAKIRQQIRTCTYFLPVISATTEMRSEGYFRREWRLAVERTLDLADDVTFLVPVVIDDTPEYQARVPEKFSTVQWLRCPGGVATPQLAALARRLAAGPSAPPVPGSRRSAPPKIGSASRDPASSRLRELPVFPAFPEAGHRLRFAYDLVVWLGRFATALCLRLPRWIRILLVVLIISKAISAFFRARQDSAPARERSAAHVIDKANRTRAALEGDALSDKIIAAAGTAIDTLQSGRPLAVVAFASTDAALKSTALGAFSALHAQLEAAGHEDEVSVGAMALPPTYTDADVVARSAVLKCRWFLTGVARPAGGDNFALEVKLYESATGKVIWQTTRTADRSAAAAVGRALADDVLQHIDFTAAPAP